MYIIHNAIKNLGRNKGRNILMGVIILAIIVTTVVSLIINNTSAGIINDYKNQFGVQVSITPDAEKITSASSGQASIPKVTSDQYLSFAQSEYLSKTVLDCSVPATSDTIKAIDQDANGGGEGKAGGNIMIKSANGASMVSPTLKLVGNSVTSDDQDFTSGQRKITDGKMYENKNECIISKDLADLNNIKTGDTITVKNAMNQTDYNLKVTGIYTDATSDYGSTPFKNSFMNRRNEILTTLETLTTGSGTSNTGVNVQATYYLKSPDLLSKFETEVRSKGLPDAYMVSSDQADYNKVVGPVEGMKSITLTFMIVVIIMGTIILLLLSSIAMRERKYEIGVLRAMGMKKNKVALGLAAEMLMITIICLVLGLGIGTASAQPVTNILLQNQITAADNAQSSNTATSGKMIVMGGLVKNGSSGSNLKAISEMNVKLGLDTFWQISLISLLLAVISSIISIRYITKYEPIRILSERS